jgi:hypothetical protein
MLELSTVGVTSAESQAIDPERLPEYHEAAQQWVKRHKDSRRNLKKKVATKRRKAVSSVPDPASAGTKSSTVEWTPSVDEIERLIAILETNSHSRDEDDQQDLLDPSLFPSPPSASAKGDNVVREDGDGDDKDEACGLWLAASMVNHSCLPNCVIHIPTSRTSRSPPQLHLRCIRPVALGEELTISYHDEEFVPTDDRQALLASRGFACRCPLCLGAVPDRARAAVCSKCTNGICSPSLSQGQPDWRCDRCGSTLSADEVRAVTNAEEEWLAQWPELLDVVETGRALDPQGIQPCKVLCILTTAARSDHTQPSALLASLPDLEYAITPLHICHSHFYGFLKWAVFEQSIWLRSHLGQDGVIGVLFAMAAIVERSLSADPASEERRVLGYWIAKEATQVLHGRAELGGVERARWEETRNEGVARWRDGMRLLYGHIES